MIGAYMEFSAVIFDMDGLMFDTERIAQLAWQRAAIEYGYQVSEDIYLGVIGKARDDVDEYLRHALGDKFPFEQVYPLKQRYLHEDIKENGLPLKPGLLELLDVLEARTIPMAVASSSPCETVLFNLNRAGLHLERYGAVVGGDEVEQGKPAPDIFLAAAEKLRVPPDMCMVLEDSSAGIRAAYVAGMIPVMVPDLIRPTEEIAEMAYRILPSLYDVLALVSG